MTPEFSFFVGIVGGLIGFVISNIWNLLIVILLMVIAKRVKCRPQEWRKDL